METAIFSSGLEYTVVRPPRFVEGAIHGDKMHVAEDGPLPIGEVNPADIAQFMLKCFYEGSWIGKTPHVSSPGKK